jgi:hypothetical protein
MPLAVDISSAFRSPHELAMLVEAVLNASENDESDWIEWKSGLDLGEKGTQGTIARHILGMANRRPEHAARYAAGCGYIIVGAEPGRCAGVAEVDPAVLSQGVHPYVGAEGPGSAAHYVNRDGASVLVVSVEPPRSGDRICTLRKEFPRYLAGTVFVRRQGSTGQAGPDDIRALEDRFAAGAAEAVARARRLRDLREIGTLIERIISQANEPANSSAWWGTRSGHARSSVCSLCFSPASIARCPGAVKSPERAGQNLYWRPLALPEKRLCPP